jgi:hypothetical protein
MAMRVEGLHSEEHHLGRRERRASTRCYWARQTLGVYDNDSLCRVLLNEEEGPHRRIVACAALSCINLADLSNEHTISVLSSLAQRRRDHVGRAAARALDRAQRYTLLVSQLDTLRHFEQIGRELGIGNCSEALVLAGNKDQVATVRRTAMLRLGEWKCRRGLPLLLAELSGSPDPEIVWVCANAMVRVGSRTVTRRLIRVASQQPELPNGQAAIYVLGMLGDKRAKPSLLQIIANRGVSAHTRALAVEAVVPLLRGRPVPDIVADLLFTDNRELRESAQSALSARPDVLLHKTGRR